jgi:hypothetical protein
VTYLAALLTCGIVFGLFVGGFVGFMEAATPAVDCPSLAQLAASDAGWTVLMRQQSEASHRYSGLAADNTRESSWLHPARTAAVKDGADSTGGASSSATGGLGLVDRGGESNVSDRIPKDRR